MLSFVVLAWWVWLPVAGSWLLAAPLILRAEHQGKEARQHLSSHTNGNSVGVVHCRMRHVHVHVQADNAAVGLCAGARQDTAVAVVSYLGLSMLTLDQIVTMMAEAMAGLVLIFGLQPLKEDRKGVRPQQSVLDDETGNEVLTWEEMDSSVRQAG